MKPKEALLKGGLITEIRRGRLSREQIQWCEEKAREGWKIDGFSVSSGVGVESPKEVKHVPATNEKVIYDIPPERYSENDFMAYVFEDGKEKEVGMRTVCNGCGASLNYHSCGTPRIWVDFNAESVVYFKERKTPLPKKRWF